MGSVEPIGPVRLGDGRVHYAQGMKAGEWVFLTGHVASDFREGLDRSVLGKPGYPMLGLPKHRREGQFILDRFSALLEQAGTTIHHGLRLDQYYPTWKAVDPYHLARHATFKSRIPPSTSILMEGLILPEADIEASLVATLPSRTVEHIQVAAASSPATSGWSPVTRLGDWIFVAGQVPREEHGLPPEAHVPEHSHWAGYEIRKQATYTINKRLRAALEAGGSSFESTVKAQVYLGNIEDLPHFLDVWHGFFGAPGPALTVVPASGFGPTQGIIEINVIALAENGATRKQVIEADVPSTMTHGPRAVRAGDLLFISGLLPVDEDGLVPSARGNPRMPHFQSSVQAQMRHMLASAQTICAAAGTSLENLVRVHQFHTDLGEFYPAFGVWEELLPGRPVPFSAVQVPGPLAAPGCTVMLDLWVYAP